MAAPLEGRSETVSIEDASMSHKAWLYGEEATDKLPRGVTAKDPASGYPAASGEDADLRRWTAREHRRRA